MQYVSNLSDDEIFHLTLLGCASLRSRGATIVQDTTGDTTLPK